MRDETRSAPVYLYGLLDPRTQTVFYIGISAYPRGRLNGHRNDPCSAAWARIREISLSGYECELQVLCELEGRQDAFDLEWQLIQEFPGLINRDKRRFNVFNWGTG